MPAMNDKQTVRVNLSGQRLKTACVLFKCAFQMLFVGKTFIRLNTNLP